jgi:hypothetical protein
VLRLQLLWLLVPALAVIELGGHFWFAGRAPRQEEWRALSPRIERLKRPGEPLLIAPEWAQPLARQAFGDAAFPLSELARPDLLGYRRVLEVSALGARTEETRGWRQLSEEDSGRFTLRILENPTPRSAKYHFVDHVHPPHLSVAVVVNGEATVCPFTDQARVSSGGLHGQVTFPRARFRCPGGDAFFVGVTSIDDQEYRPRRCIWARPPESGALRLRFSNVPVGRSLRGFAGLSYFLHRDGVGKPITLRARIGEHVVGEYTHRDEWGFRGFEFATAGVSAASDVEFEITAEGGMARDFCFLAESIE